MDYAVLPEDIGESAAMFARSVGKTHAKAAVRKPASQRSPAPQFGYNPVEQIYRLQRSIGNQATVRFLGRATGKETDPREDEANRMADGVMGMPAPRGSLRSDERQAPGVGGERQGPGSIPASTRSQGQPLDPHTRDFMEARFGRDFGHVRIHTGTSASRSAEAMTARAYTVGSDIGFRQGEYAPDTPGGRHLLAHELAHTMQQEGGETEVQCKPDDKKVAPENETIPSRPWNEIVNEVLYGPPEYVPKLNIDPKVLASEDKAFAGREGQLFKKRVEEAAAKVDLDPGLLAATLLAESGRESYTGTSGEQSTFVIGADDFLSERAAIEKRIPAAKDIAVAWASTNINENRRQVSTAHFDARQAALVDAIYLKYGELRVRDAFKAHGVDFDSLKPELRFAFTRLAMNPGKIPVKTQIDKFLQTRDIEDTAPGVLIRTGVKDQDARKPQSGATRVAGIGLHLSQAIFGNTYVPSSLELRKPKKP